MKKYVAIFFLLALYMVPTAVFAKDDTMKPLVTEPIQMYGPKSEANFSYAIDGQAEAGSIHLTTSHSSLLMPPSSLTVAIDGLVMETIDLATVDGEPSELIVPLTKEGLTKGEHTVTLKFDGIVKEGGCVDQHTNGNWLTVHLQSYVQLEGYDRDYSMNLKSFTEDFKALEGEHTAIIIPEDANSATQSVAIRLQAQLSQVSSKKSQVEITTKPEKRDKWVIVGESEQFTNKDIKQLIQDINVQENGMMIGKLDPSTAYLLASDAVEIEQYLHILFQPEMVKQLAGEQLYVRSLPNVQPSTVQTFEQLNIAPITIDSINPKTAVYYATLPYALPLKEHTIFHFELQKSSFLDNHTKDISDHMAELLLQVNGKMHPISLEKLVDHQTHYTIDIPVSNDLLMEDATFAFQLIGNGFQRLDPCMTTDQRQWLQIDTKKSAIQFTNPRSEKMDGTFKNLPFPFAFDQTVIVVPSFDEVSSNMYEAILNRFRWNNQPTRIVLADELTDDLRKAGNLILLNTNLKALGADKSILPEQIEDAGFIAGTEKVIATMEQNPWNQDKAVITIEQQDGELRTTDFINELFIAKSPSTIAVYTSAGNISFNKESRDEEGIETTGTPINQTMLFAFIGLLVAIVAIIIFIVRRNRRNTTV